MIILPWIAMGREPISILLLGTDEQRDLTGGEDQVSRADAIFLLTIHPEQGGFRLLSIERDYLVELPGDLGPNKLGTSTYFGGPDLAIDMVNQLFQTNVAHYIQIDIQGIIKAVDYVGGITVEVYEDEVDEVNYFIDGIMTYKGLRHVTAGMNRLNGPEAWAFMGVRNQEIDSVLSNAGRNDRQRRVVAAGMEQLSGMDFHDAFALSTELLPLIKTNISLSYLFEIIQQGLTNDVKNIKQMYTPQGEYQIRTVRMHRVVIVSDMEQEVQGVHSFLFEE